MQIAHHFLEPQAGKAQISRLPGRRALATGLRQGLSITLVALLAALSSGCVPRVPQASELAKGASAAKPAGAAKVASTAAKRASPAAKPASTAAKPASTAAKPASTAAKPASAVPKAVNVVAKAPRRTDLASERASRDVRFIANWVIASSDNGKLSFVIIDKKNTRAFVFDPAGRLLGASPVLLGAATGDESVPGIGERALAQVKPEERTTPAGRFIGELGRNLSGEDIVWVDYDAAVSMHRVRATNAQERRLQRLASSTTADNRISFGCINMPAAFYEKVLSPQFKGRHGVVYVLPDIKPVREVFAKAYDPSARQRAATSRQAAATAGAVPARL